MPSGLWFSLRSTKGKTTEKLKIIVKDTKGNIQYFNSISECSLNININRKIIKDYLITGASYNGYTFKFDTHKK